MKLKHGLIALPLLFAIILSFSLFVSSKEQVNQVKFTERINGASFTGPPKPVHDSSFASLKRINANYVAILPYAYSRKGESFVRFGSDRQWWGERPEGVRILVKAAKSYGLKVMLKPQVWVIGQGWAGQFAVEKEEDWLAWEEDYQKYILEFAKIAEELEVEMLCVGTEYKLAVKARPLFWSQLINEVKKVYTGKLTYAANWDNYQNIPFWSELDIIGVDAYFPLLQDENPDLASIKKAWRVEKENLRKYSSEQNKPIMFAEFGYKSFDRAIGNQWEIEYDYNPDKVNMDIQYKGYQAIFEEFWHEPWFAGGFLWKWHSNHQNAGGLKHADYTPQNKPAQSLIQEWFKKTAD